MKKSLIALAILVVAVPGYMVIPLAYSQTAMRFPVSFSIGADLKEMAFDVPILLGWVRVEVVVDSGTSVLTANIMEHDNVVWTYSTRQGDQTTYTSGWITVLSGHYNFTYATVGLGSLEGKITVTTIGGVW